MNPDAVGTTSDPVESSWNSKDALIYAVGVGCGVPDPLAATELPFMTENSKDVKQQALPTLGVVLGMGGGGAMMAAGTFNPAMLVHGEQAIELHQPLPVEGRISTTGKITGIYDKGSG